MVGVAQRGDDAPVALEDEVVQVGGEDGAEGRQEFGGLVRGGDVQRPLGDGRAP